MTFTENLESAKNGNRRSYGMLCNEYADKLYAVAMLVLDTPSDGETAVRNAFEDGFRAITRINDGNHLKAWLSRELTKHLVAKLKEYRAEEKSVSDNNIPEKKLLCRLNDLDRLVYTLNLTFEYGVKELTVITGLKEESVERKIRDSEKKLSKEKNVIISYINSVKAPESLITKPPKVHDLTVEINTGDDDELINEMERIAAFAEAEENGISEEKPAAKNAIKFVPASEEFVTEIKSDKPKNMPFGTAIEEEKAPDIPDLPTDEASELMTTSVEHEIGTEFFDDVHHPFAEMEIKEDDELSSEYMAPTMEEAITEAVEEQVAEETEPVQEKPKELDARTFINVITAQRIKGSEFLKLMGNTRISNTAYREIEQNPNLTKEKLIRLLEESPLTSEDYVKVLTAIKQRSEMMSRKEEASRRHEQAGLFSVNKPKPEAKPIPELSANDTQSFAVSEPVKDTVEEMAAEPPFEPEEQVQPIAEEPKLEEVKKPEPEETKGPETPPVTLSDKNKPFTIFRDPDIDFSGDDEPDDGEDEPEIRNEIKKETPVAVPEGSRREKYKGREYFIDDDVYYKGVNNGKIIFCAVFAVLLIAGSFGIRYLKTGSFMPTETPVIQTVPEEKLPEEYVSDADIYKAISMLETKVTVNESGYYKTDDKGYTEALTKDFAETEDMFYIYRDGKILIYSLNSENPSVYSEFMLDEEREFLGFSVTDSNRLYIFYSDTYTETLSFTVTTEGGEDETPITEEKSVEINRPRVTVECYEKDKTLSHTYSQDGELRAVSVGESSAAIATFLNTAKTAVAENEKSFLPSYSFSKSETEKSSIGFNDITVHDEIKYNGFTVIGKFSSDEARAHAVLGGTNGYVDFEGDRCRVLNPDENKTFLTQFKFIGNTLSPDTTESYTGECIGMECINGTGDIITAYDSVNGSALVQKKSGEEFVTVGGIGVGEKLKGVSYTDTKAFIVTENAEGKEVLYCADVSGDELTAAAAAQNSVYTEKLKTFGENLIGMTVTADESGNRTGLSLNIYGYDNGLSVKRSAVITMDEKTADEYIRYLSADAEESNLRIAVDETETIAAVSTVYFDGISEIERILCFKDDGTALNQCAELLLFDIRSDYRYLTIRGNILYILTDSSVITINAENGSPVGYFRKDAQEQADMTETETEETEEQAAIE